jgi:hypothetical protein
VGQPLITEGYDERVWWENICNCSRNAKLEKVFDVTEVDMITVINIFQSELQPI